MKKRLAAIVFILVLSSVTILNIAFLPGCNKPTGTEIAEDPWKGQRERLQKEYLKLKFGMFLHYNMSTYSRCCCPDCYSTGGEWEQGKAREPANLFAPTNLDCGQWARTARYAGCKYVVLVTKHHGGFCQWPTATTDYSVKNGTWPGGQWRNTVKEFADSMRAYGLEPGFYFSIWDRTEGAKADTTFIKAQLNEILDTNVYGKIRCIWFDGWGWKVGYIRVPYQTIRNCVKKNQPNCLLIEQNHNKTATDSTELMEYEFPVDNLIPAGNTKPGECNTPIRADDIWFYHDRDSCILKSAERIVTELNAMNTGTANYLLDLTPDKRGQIPDCQVERMRQVGAILRTQGWVIDTNFKK